ncbi:MAG: heme o synthase [Candidatus Methylacidiphilales bacterium]|nr:heme o synthase [Candidatus Methylacidiphilales bacterium]
MPQVDAQPSPSIKGLRRWMGDFSVLVKLRLTLLVLATTVAGFYLGKRDDVGWVAGLHVLWGTGLVAAGAAALNQLLEIKADSRMRRTQDRPLPAGRIGEQDALLMGVLLSGFGLSWLFLLVNPLSALLAALTLAAYLFLYTPAKKLSALNTLIGAVPGALPPVIGWTGATGRIDAGAVVLFGLLFLWQMPHFLAIAWLYREDYARGGFRMLTLDDETGRSTGIKSALYGLLLLPVAAAPWWLGQGGVAGLVVGLLFTSAYAAAALHMALRPGKATARTLFFTSLAYLPAMLILLALDKQG